MDPIRITKLEKTCDACPAQWDAKTEDGRDVYIRYRWGVLSIRVAKEKKLRATNGEELLRTVIDPSGWSGTLNEQQLKEAAGSAIEFY